MGKMDPREIFVPGQPVRAALGLGWKVLAFAFLPVCVGIGLLLGALGQWGAGVVLAAILWIGGLSLLAGRGSLSGKRVVLLILLLIAGSAAEGFVWANLVLH